MEKIKKTLSVFIAVVMCLSMFSTTAFATDEVVANGTAGEGVTWVLDSNGTLTISGTGEMDTEWYAPPWEEYNTLITAVVVEEGITEIPSTTFCYAENLLTVSVPSTVTKIGNIAFWACFSLEAINVAEDNTVYKSIDGILFSEDEATLVKYPANKSGTEYTIPAFVTTIGVSAFEDNVALESVTIPDTVISIGADAFYSSKIDSVMFGNGITEIPSSCFSGSDVKMVVISDSVNTIGSSSFYSADYLETLFIGSGVEAIGSNILRYTDSLSVVHYKGTQEDWDAITIDEENEDLNSKELHFISEDDYREGMTPTCAEGHTSGYYCDDCEMYVTGNVLDAVDEHNWNNGVCETCGETCIHIDGDFNEICDECGSEFSIKIDETNTVYIQKEHEGVVVKFTSTESGIYAVISDNGGDEANIDPYVDVYDSNGKYVASDDDSDYEDTYNFYCEFEAEAGETYYIELNSYDSDVQYDYIITKHIDIDHQPTSAEPYVTLTWDIEAEYQWVEITDDDIVFLDGETSATLKNPKIGTEYGCIVTYDGIEIYSDAMLYRYAITHQPTAEEPYVELNDDTDATYQWYSAKEAIIEITDEQVELITMDESSSYDAEKGWSGCYMGKLEGLYDCLGFFEIPLEKGDTIFFELTGDYYYGVELMSIETGAFYRQEISTDGKCEFVAEKDDVYLVSTYKAIDGDYVYLKAYANGYEYTAIDGATDATIQDSKFNTKYACEVTFTDGTTEMSDVFEILNSWVLENGKWAYYEKGVKATNRWLLDSVGWCYVGADGYCVTNEWKADSKGWCYLGADGRMVTNQWVRDSVSWCYVGADGYCVTDKWMKDSIGWVYLDASGRMATNRWVRDSVSWCYVGADGYCVTNTWKADSKGWCYLGADGRMVTNKWLKDGNNWYYLDANGYMVTGTKRINGKTYKFASNGVWIG